MNRLRWPLVVAAQWIRRNRTELVVWSAILSYLGILVALILVAVVNLVRWFG